ncbi:hypothetical protein ACJD0Z_10005 [Flavobacteriaceae bacterium M23B6Z8]
MFQLIHTFVIMQSRIQHISAIILLGIFLFVKIISVHSYMHLLQDEDAYVENCTHCEFQLHSNELPFTETAVLVAATPSVQISLEVANYYSTPLVENLVKFSFSNKAPPVLS